MAASSALGKSHHMDDHLPHTADGSCAVNTQSMLLHGGKLEHIHEQTPLYLGKWKREKWENNLLKCKFARASTVNEQEEAVISNQINAMHHLSSTWHLQTNLWKIKPQQEVWLHSTSIWCLLCVTFLCTEKQETLGERGLIGLSINELEVYRSLKSREVLLKAM